MFFTKCKSNHLSLCAKVKSWRFCHRCSVALPSGFWRRQHQRMMCIGLQISFEAAEHIAGAGSIPLHTLLCAISEALWNPIFGLLIAVIATTAHHIFKSKMIGEKHNAVLHAVVVIPSVVRNQFQAQLEPAPRKRYGHSKRSEESINVDSSLRYASFSMTVHLQDTKA
jgi:hypothetical protein